MIPDGPAPPLVSAGLEDVALAAMPSHCVTRVEAIMEGIDVLSKRIPRNHQRFGGDVQLVKLRFMQWIQTGE